MMVMRAILATMLLLAVGLWLGGCNSSEPIAGSPSARTGSARLSISWPSQTTRLIPARTNSIAVEISTGDFTRQQLILRPVEGNESTVEFADLPIGTLTVAATAYPTADGTGVPLAAGNAPMVTKGGEITPVTLTMASTIDHLELTAPAGTLTDSDTLDMTATPRDVQGRVVLVAPGSITWAATPGTVATIDTGSGRVHGVSPGRVSVTATEAESGATGNLELTVTRPPGTLLATIPIVSRPEGLAFMPKTNRIYIASYNNAVGVVDGGTNTTLTTIPIAGVAGDVAVNPQTNRVYVSVYNVDTSTGGVAVFDGSTHGLITTMPQGANQTGIGMLAVNEATNRIYRAAGTWIEVYDGETNRSINSCYAYGSITGLAVNEMNKQVYVTRGDGGLLIGNGTNAVPWLTYNFYAQRVAVNPFTNRIYTTDTLTGVVNCVDRTTYTRTPIAVGRGPVGIAVNRATNRIYVTHPVSNTISVIDGETNTVLATMPTGASPEEVCVNEAANRVYVVNAGDATLSVFQGY